MHARRSRNPATLAVLILLAIVSFYVPQREEPAPVTVPAGTFAAPAPSASPSLAPPSATAPAPKPSATYLVSRVVDGDTLIVEGLGRVRLIGVNTPESVDPRRSVQRFGKEAGAFLRRMVEHQRVRVEYDWDRTDDYDRTLAYLYLPDGTFVNEELVRRGYAYAFTKYPFKHSDAFRRLEREARAARRGLWEP